MTIKNVMTQKQILQETHDAVIRLETKLPFIVEEVKEVKSDLDDLSHSHGKLKRNFWMLVGILTGSGVIGGGLYGLLNGV